MLVLFSDVLFHPLHAVLVAATCCRLLQPEKYISRRLPLPLPAAGWHPKYDKKFDAIGQIPPDVRQNGRVPERVSAASLLENTSRAITKA